MTFDVNVPNGGQSPGLFPLQNNTNFFRLKTIINADHVFNDTAQSTDGVHRQVTMIVRATPVGLPTGTNGILYSKIDGAGQTQLYFYNGNLDYSITAANSETVISGTVNVSGSFTNMSLIPPNVFGDVYLWKGLFMQAGTFVSDGSSVNGYSFAEKFESGTGATQILRLGYAGDGASGLNLRVQNDRGSSFNGIWTYKIFYRPKA